MNESKPNGFPEPTMAKSQLTKREFVIQYVIHRTYSATEHDIAQAEHMWDLIKKVKE